MPGADYFGGLMRASGLLAPQPARGALRDSIERVEREAPDAAPVVSAQPVPMASAEPPVREAQTAPPAAARVNSEHDASDRSSAVPAEAAPSPAGAVSAAASPGQTTAPELARTLVRSAMQWVATDPNGVTTSMPQPAAAPDSATLRPALAPRTEIVSEAAPVHRAGPQAPGEPVAVTPAHEVTARAVDAPELASPASEPWATPPTPDTPPAPMAWPAPHVATASAAPRRVPEPPAAEPLTVTIGAIHLRVDAPAVQTVTPPAAPAARPVPERNPQRSGLSRRALRRI